MKSLNLEKFVKHPTNDQWKLQETRITLFQPNNDFIYADTSSESAPIFIKVVSFKNLQVISPILILEVLHTQIFALKIILAEMLTFEFLYTIRLLFVGVNI